MAGTTDFTGLNAGTTLAAADVVAFVDVSDTSQSANGSTLKITMTNFFATVPAPVNVTSASATALAVGRLGATTPAFTVDASTASQVAGLKVTGAATGGTVAVVVTDSGSNANLTINAKGSGTIGIGSVSTGAVTITPATTIAAGLTVAVANTLSQVTVGESGSAGTYAALRMLTGSVHYAWLIGAQYNVGESLEITPSTAQGGTTFSTPVVTINQSGAVTLTGTLAVTGAITTTASQGLLVTPTTATDAAYVTFTNTGGMFNIGADNSVGGLSGTAYALTIFAPANRSVVIASDNAPALTLGASQAATFAGTLAVTGDVAVNTNKFTVAASSGNTVVAGTLAVTGDITGAGSLTMNAAIGISAVGFFYQSGTLNPAIYIATAGKTFSIQNTALSNLFSVAEANGNTFIAGHIGIGASPTATSPVHISGLPTSSAGLASGDVWLNSNVLTIVP